MNWKKLYQWLDIGYGLPEFKRDRHLFFTVVLGWLAVDASPWMTGTLDHATFQAHGIFALSMAVTSVIKNLIVHNDDPDVKPNDTRKTI